MDSTTTLEAPFVARPLASYVRALRQELPEESFRPARSRALLVPLHVGLIAIATIAIAGAWVPLPIQLVLSVIIGLSFSGLAFVGHEALHGAVVRGRRARQVLGWFGFLPFMFSPKLWDAWHGKIHHANTNRPGDDPDGYPTLAEYHGSRRVRVFIHWFALGGRRWRGALSLVLGFSVQGAITLAFAVKRGYMTRRAWRIAIAETALAVAVWATVAALVGLVPFLLVYVVPLLIGNAVVMAFILTNHSLSPLTEVNDPLISGLSVTVPRWVQWATLHFGLHVEHHLFPAMSSRHAPRVQRLLRARWPERYQSMSLWRALLALHRTSRVYKDAITLVDPTTGAEYRTLLPGPPGTTTTGLGRDTIAPCPSS
jgi:fatty acid desaturase